MADTCVHALPKVERSGDTIIITVSGGKIRDVDNVLARDLDGLTDGVPKRRVLLDFINVEFVSSVELGTLIGLHKKLRACGGQLTLFNLNHKIFEIFSITRLDDLLMICREDRPNGRADGNAS